MFVAATLVHSSTFIAPVLLLLLQNELRACSPFPTISFFSVTVYVSFFFKAIDVKLLFSKSPISPTVSSLISHLSLTKMSRLSNGSIGSFKIY